jgi:hypothetical protein
VAPRDIPPGADWAAEIIEGLDAAYAMLLLLTASAMYSPQVRREVERAVHKAIPVIALRLDHEPLSKSLEYFLSAQHWIDARDRVHEAHRPAVMAPSKKVPSDELLLSPPIPRMIPPFPCQLAGAFPSYAVTRLPD